MGERVNAWLPLVSRNVLQGARPSEVSDIRSRRRAMQRQPSGPSKDVLFTEPLKAAGIDAGKKSSYRPAI